MRIVKAILGVSIQLGRQGENLVTEVQFDVKGWADKYGAGTFTLLNKRSVDPDGYPVALTVAGDVASWIPTSADLKYAGCGVAELVYTVGDAIAKSEKYGTEVLEALGGTGETPEPWQPWYDDVMEAKDEALEAAAGAEEARVAIEDMTATAEIDDTTGTPTVVVTKTTVEDPDGTTHENLDFAFSGLKSAADMEAAVYDPDGSVAEAGGIADYVAEEISDLAPESEVQEIKDLIPNQASPENQLVDENFVNSSISTNTANYISNNGQPFTSVAQLEAYSGPVSNNDYAFVTGTDSAGNTFYDRYKATVAEGVISWAFEYRLNNSSFTAAQWAAIESGITASQVANYNAHLANRDNPHSVTKEQVGLGNVDNTPDSLKPVSQAQAAALALKADKVVDAVAGDFAALDANGNLTDSGISKEISEQLEGELVSFKAAYAVPLKALSVALAPIQDLNGYASPWPAGGGKNKLMAFAAGTVNGATVTISADGRMVISGGFSPYRANASDVHLAAGTYMFSVAYTAGSINAGLQFEIKDSGGTTVADSIISISSGDSYQIKSVSVAIPSDGDYHFSMYTSAAMTGLTLGIMLEAGSTATDFAPYENICPISGHSEVNATRAGKNLFDKNWTFVGSSYITADGSIASNPNYSYCEEYIKVKPNAAYVLSGTLIPVGYNSVAFYDANKAFLSRYLPDNPSTPSQFTTPANCVFIRFNCSNTNLIDKNTIQLEEGTAASEYEAYSGADYAISLGSTVYGGTVDVTGGEGEETALLYKPATSTYKESTGTIIRIWLSVSTYDVPVAAERKCTHLEFDYVHGTAPDNGCYYYFKDTTYINVYIRLDGVTDTVAHFNDWLTAQANNGTPFGFVLKKATPSALTTTPTEIDTLEGDNNVYADNGPVTLERWKGLGEIIAAVHEALSA